MEDLIKSHINLLNVLRRIGDKNPEMLTSEDSKAVEYAKEVALKIYANNLDLQKATVVVTSSADVIADTEAHGLICTCGYRKSVGYLQNWQYCLVCGKPVR